jgi:hypothetical protein
LAFNSTRKKSKRKTTVNLSIDTDTLEKLKAGAESKEKTSLNSHINSILTKYVNFYWHAESIGCSIWPPEIFAAFLELMDQDNVIRILSRYGEEAVSSFFYNNNLPVTKNNLIKYALGGIGIWTGQYSFIQHYQDNEGYTVVILNHKFGPKWSDILGKLHCHWTERLLNCPVQLLNLSSTTVIFRILQKDYDDEV